MEAFDDDERYLDRYDSWEQGRYFVTYTLFNKLTGKIYSGMTHGYRSEPPEEAVRTRYKEHVGGARLQKRVGNLPYSINAAPAKALFLAGSAC